MRESARGGRFFLLTARRTRARAFIFGIIVELVLLQASAAVLTQAFAQSAPETATSGDWTLKDSASSNITTMDPIQIADAFSIDVLANVYEGLATFDKNGQIAPALADSWESSADGKVWTFHLRNGVAFHPVRQPCVWKAPAEVSSRDVIYSFARVMTDAASIYKWAFGDLIEGASHAKGEAISGLSAPDDHTVVIRLTRPFPILNRLVMVAGWVYPHGIVEACGKDYLSINPVGTGPFRLTRFVPDDRIELARFSNYRLAMPKSAPAGVQIIIEPDPAAAFESFRAGRVDVVELSLDTVDQGRSLAAREADSVVSVKANYLDYLVMNNRIPPFDDIRVREAINAAIDRDGLTRTLSGMVQPAFGVLPPTSPSYRGDAAMRREGFQYDPVRGKELLREYVAEKGLGSIVLQLTIDSGELPETIGQYVQASLERNLGLSVRLEKVTWPELLQTVFGGGGGSFYRFWWIIVTPGDDLYFQFFLPGHQPPNGFNLSAYSSATFSRLYSDAFSARDAGERERLTRGLEDQLIKDAVAVPLFHRTYIYLERHGIQLRIDGFLRKDYRDARREVGAK